MQQLISFIENERMPHGRGLTAAAWGFCYQSDSPTCIMARNCPVVH